MTSRENFLGFNRLMDDLSSTILCVVVHCCGATLELRLRGEA